MTTTEIIAILGCGALFVLLGMLTRDRSAGLLLRAHDDGTEGCETDAGQCGGCAKPCETSERHDG